MSKFLQMMQPMGRYISYSTKERVKDQHRWWHIKYGDICLSSIVTKNINRNLLHCASLVRFMYSNIIFGSSCISAEQKAFERSISEVEGTVSFPYLTLWIKKGETVKMRSSQNMLLSARVVGLSTYCTQKAESHMLHNPNHSDAHSSRIWHWEHQHSLAIFQCIFCKQQKPGGIWWEENKMTKSSLCTHTGYSICSVFRLPLE